MHLSKRYGKPYQRWNIGWIVSGIALSGAALALALSQTYGYFKPVYLVTILALAGLNILFMFLMPAPTEKGQKLGTEIDGFRLYIKTAENRTGSTQSSSAVTSPRP